MEFRCMSCGHLNSRKRFRSITLSGAMPSSPTSSSTSTPSPTHPLTQHSVDSPPASPSTRLSHPQPSRRDRSISPARIPLTSTTSSASLVQPAQISNIPPASSGVAAPGSASAGASGSGLRHRFSMPEMARTRTASGSSKLREEVVVGYDADVDADPDVDTEPAQPQPQPQQDFESPVLGGMDQPGVDPNVCPQEGENQPMQWETSTPPPPPQQYHIPESESEPTPLDDPSTSTHTHIDDSYQHPSGINPTAIPPTTHAPYPGGMVGSVRAVESGKGGGYESDTGTVVVHEEEEGEEEEEEMVMVEREGVEDEG
ncbi:hypothetical protein HK102_012495 [Quaeritorhiza haematococci]|nr:hypothetical protein HK102_012495 [Quaeritorhiza haematococci]